MKYQSIDYPVVGDSFNTDYERGSNQRTLNMYIELLRNGITDAALYSFPGLKLWSAQAGKGQGLYAWEGKGYHVNDSVLYSFNSTGAKTAIGSVPGSGHAIFKDNGSVLFIHRGQEVTEYDGTTLTASSSLNAFNPTAIDIINQQIVATTADNRWVTTDAGTSTVTTGIGSAENMTLVAPFVYNDFLFLFADDRVVPWENVGIGSPPFSRLTGAIADDIGLAGPLAVARSKKAMYFLSPDGNAYQMQTFVAQPISSTARSREWQQYNTLADCQTKVLDILGHVFVIFMFPFEQKAHVYDESIGNWFELDDGAEQGMWLGNDVLSLFGKQLVSDRFSGNIYEIDKETHTNNGSVQVRERVFRAFSSETFKDPRQRLQSKEFRIACETDDTDNDYLMVSFSKDGGKTYGTERWLSLGELGDAIQKLRTNYKQKFYDLLVKARYTADADLALYTSGIDIRRAGR